MPISTMLHKVDPAQAIRDKIGSDHLDTIQVPGALILVGIYMRPNMTAGGIMLSDKTREEDMWQGKVGLVLKVGALAYSDEDVFKKGSYCKAGDWVLFKAVEGQLFLLNEHPCRMIDDYRITAVIDGPDGVL